MNTDWFIIPFIISTGLLAFVKFNYNDYIKLVLFSSINNQASNIIYKENKNNKPKSSYILIIVFLISGSMFILQLFQKFAPAFTTKYFWFIIPVFLILFANFIIFSKISNYISGKIFLQSEISSEYNHNITIFIQTLGITLLPITILISYTKAANLFIYIGIIIFAIIYLLKIIRLFKININKQLNILYMFLYLCTLEIIPILYFIKIVMLL